MYPFPDPIGCLPAGPAPNLVFVKQRLQQSYNLTQTLSYTLVTLTYVFIMICPRRIYINTYYGLFTNMSTFGYLSGRLQADPATDLVSLLLRIHPIRLVLYHPVLAPWTPIRILLFPFGGACFR